MAEPRDTFTTTAPEVPMLRKPHSTEASQFTAVRDNATEYKGTDGDVTFTYSTSRTAYAADAKGSYLALEGMSDRIHLVKLFGGKLPVLNAGILHTTDTDFEILGTSADATDVVNATTGGITISTHGGATDSTIILPHLDADVTPWTTNVWATSKELRWEVDFVTDSAIADTTLWFGLKLTNTPVTATDNEQAFFRFHEDTNSGKWQAITSVGGADVAADTGVTVAVSTRYHFVITVDSSRVPRYYINGALVATGAALASGNLIPYAGILSDTTGTDKNYRLIKMAISKKAA